MTNKPKLVELNTPPAARSGSRSRVLSGRRLTPYLFLAPALLWYLIFLIYPMLSSLILSFYEWDGLSETRTFVGLQNYQTVFFDRISRQALTNNIIWMLVTLAVPTVLGLLLAVALDQAIPGRRLFRSIFYGTGIMPLVAVGIIWSWMYNPQFGLINAVLEQVGLGSLARGWLSDYATALPATLVTAIWQGTGFPMILYLAGLQGIPREQYDAARIDGANGLQCFRYVTLPWLRETHIIVITLAIINSFKVFDLIYTMTYGGPGRSTQVLATWMYFNTFQYYNAGLGSAIAWVIVLLSLSFAIPYIRINSRQ